MGKSEGMDDDTFKHVAETMGQGGFVGVRRVPMYQPKDGDTIKFLPSQRAVNLAKGTTLTPEQVESLIEVADKFRVMVTDVIEAVAKGMVVIGRAFDHVRDMVERSLQSGVLDRYVAELAVAQARYLPGVVRAAIRLGRTTDFAFVWDATRRYTRRGRVYMPVLFVAYETMQIHDSVTLTLHRNGVHVGDRRWRTADVQFMSGLGFDCVLWQNDEGTNMEMVYARIGRVNASGTKTGRLQSSRPNMANIPVTGGTAAAALGLTGPVAKGPAGKPVAITTVEEFVNTYGHFGESDDG